MDEFEAILETGGAAAVELAASAVAARGGKTMPCPNCGKPMIGPFCAMCGQPLNTHRRSLVHLLRDFVKDVASFDSRILRTAKALLLRPGELPKAFREGRTQRYVPAVRLYFFVSLLFFLFLGATGIAILQFGFVVDSYRLVHDDHGQVFKLDGSKRVLMEGFKADAKGNVQPADTGDAVEFDPTMKADGSVSNNLTSRITFFQRIQPVKAKPSPQLEAALKTVQLDFTVNGQKTTGIAKAFFDTFEKLKTDPAALNGPLETWIPRILFVLLPIFALLLTLFYRGQRKHFFFVDHLVFSFNIHSFLFVVLIGAAIAAQLLSGIWVARLTLLVLSVYFFLSLKSFYGQSWVATAVKCAAISFTYAVFFLAPALAFALVASVLGGS
ncbi:MAG: DUF3667 domain-containing protein [Rhizomicrobium sp.]|nr:DUF3667 domain-containing protein [Rhizomicrobium sp.]